MLCRDVAQQQSLIAGGLNKRQQSSGVAQCVQEGGSLITCCMGGWVSKSAGGEDRV
jgi:hypothetical protein